MSLTEQQREALQARYDALAARRIDLAEQMGAIHRVLSGTVETPEELAALRTKIQAREQQERGR